MDSERIQYTICMAYRHCAHIAAEISTAHALQRTTAEPVIGYYIDCFIGGVFICAIPEEIREAERISTELNGAQETADAVPVAFVLRTGYPLYIPSVTSKTQLYSLINS